MPQLYLLQSSNYANVRLQLDEPQRRLSVDNAHALLDFGGLGKGLALDDIKRLLLEEGVQSCFVSFGESSILALGRHPTGMPAGCCQSSVLPGSAAGNTRPAQSLSYLVLVGG